MSTQRHLSPYEKLPSDKLWVCPVCSQVFNQRPAVNGKVKYESYAVKKIIRHMASLHSNYSPNEYRGIEFRYHIQNLEGRYQRKFSHTYHAVYDSQFVYLYLKILRKRVIPQIVNASPTATNFYYGNLFSEKKFPLVSETVLFSSRTYGDKHDLYFKWLATTFPNASHDIDNILEDYWQCLLILSTFREFHVNKPVPQDIDILNVERWDSHFPKDIHTSQADSSLEELARVLTSYLHANPVSPIYFNGGEVRNG